MSIDDIRKAHAEWVRRKAVIDMAVLLDAANEDAARLARFLSALHRFDHHDDPDGYCGAHEALRLHDERVR